jgi:hypothetical protein
MHASTAGPRQENHRNGGQHRPVPHPLRQRFLGANVLRRAKPGKEAIAAPARRSGLDADGEAFSGRHSKSRTLPRSVHPKSVSRRKHSIDLAVNIEELLGYARCSSGNMNTALKFVLVGLNCALLVQYRARRGTGTGFLLWKVRAPESQENPSVASRQTRNPIRWRLLIAALALAEKAPAGCVPTEADAGICFRHSRLLPCVGKKRYALDPLGKLPYAVLDSDWSFRRWGWREGLTIPKGMRYRLP